MFKQAAMISASLILAGCGSQTIPVEAEIPHIEKAPPSPGVLAVRVEPDPGAPCRLFLKGPGMKPRQTFCDHIEQVPPGDWDVLLRVAGQPDRSEGVVVESGVVSRHTFKFQWVGGVRSTALQDQAAHGPSTLTTLDGRRVIVGKHEGTVPAGVYRLPKGDDYFVVSIGRKTTLPASGETDTTVKPAPAIVVAGKRFFLDDDVPVVTFGTEGSLDFHALQGAKKKRGRNTFLEPRRVDGKDVDPTDLAAIRPILKYAVLHSDLNSDSAENFSDLKKVKLSTHFMIDFDGTIYQAADLAYTAFHVGALNNAAIGIDLNNLLPNLHSGVKRGAPAYDPNHPRIEEMLRHPRSKSAMVKINGGRVQTYGYTMAQRRSLGTLLRAIAAIFPNLPAQVPLTADGKPVWTAPEDITKHAGVVGHLHTSNTRWDPGPGIDWLDLQGMISRPGTAWMNEDSPVGDW